MFSHPQHKPLENPSEDGVTNVVQTFCGLKEIGIIGHGVMAKMPTMSYNIRRPSLDYPVTQLMEPTNGLVGLIETKCFPFGI